ncbi:PIN-like domain-containing protein [Bacillus pseudomycoides]|uniref:PIN-like domain-containing protein n=1 Tax=Bacillus pseudomycoides TaxID=64104 RepID=UPI0005343F06|nr:PIN-like domain-containing protein [Bacillus pseudomycoides]MDR4187793.1 hypothetical protein [Bacillus pseudomycoides]MED0857250.1 PIN-like domain-containing protein [Bacillus pseudomycoides]
MINKEYFDSVWQHGYIILDTSTLDYIERCNVKMAKKLMDIFLIINKRVLTPNHVKEVEMQNYFNLNKEKTTYSELVSKLIDDIRSLNATSSKGKMSSKIQKFLNKLIRYEHIELVNILNKAKSKGTEELLRTLESQEFKRAIDEYDIFLQSDTVKNFYHKVMHNKLKGFSNDELKSIKIEGFDRMKNKIPPAFKDGNKTQNQFGDLIIWKEILQLAKHSSKPIIFITEDRKCDWFDDGKNAKVMHNTLKKEVKSLCKRDIVEVITLKTFVDYSENYANEDIKDLISYFFKREMQITDLVEDFLRDNLYDDIEERVYEVISSEVDIDYTALENTMDSKIDFDSIDYEIVDNVVYINAQVSIYLEGEHCVRFGGDDFSDSGEINVSGIINMKVNIIEGSYSDKLYVLDIDVAECEIIDFSVDSFDTPFGIGDDDYEEDDCNDYDNG